MTLDIDGLLAELKKEIAVGNYSLDDMALREALTRLKRIGEIAQLPTGKFDDMPKAAQWCLKLLYDAENLDINALSELPGSVVTAEEVLEEVRKLRMT